MTASQVATTIGRGLVAGAAGTAAITVSSTVEAKLRHGPLQRQERERAADDTSYEMREKAAASLDDDLRIGSARRGACCCRSAISRRSGCSGFIFLGLIGFGFHPGSGVRLFVRIFARRV